MFRWPFATRSHAHEILRGLWAISDRVNALRIEVEQMAGELDALKKSVADNTTVIGSAITLIQGLKQKLDDAIASGDPAALTALSAELGAQDQALADTVAANTPADPTA
jgi:hypothetical protein